MWCLEWFGKEVLSSATCVWPPQTAAAGTLKSATKIYMCMVCISIYVRIFPPACRQSSHMSHPSSVYRWIIDHKCSHLLPPYGTCPSWLVPAYSSSLSSSPSWATTPLAALHGTALHRMNDKPSKCCTCPANHRSPPRCTGFDSTTASWGVRV